MNEKLIQMGTEAARAAQHAEAATVDLTLAEEEHEKAGADKVEGETMQGEADALFLKAKENEALVVTEEGVADGEAAKAAEEEEQALAHFAEVVSLHAIVDEERIQAVADSTAAARADFTAHGDELGTGLCEMIPVLDVVCDIVGGTAAVGLEATAAVEAVESAALIAAAVEAEAEEEAETALAVEFQSAATKDGQLAAEGHATSEELETEAETELAEAREEETAAQEKLDQIVLEEEAAEAEEGEAVEEEAQSDTSFAKSAQYGVAAFSDACLATVVSLATVGFFAVRFTSIIALSATAHLPSIVSSGANGLPLKRLGHVYMHCILFGIALGCFGSRFFLHFDSLKVRSRGGIILLFALDVAVAQALLVHAFPKMWTNREMLMTRINACSLAFLLSVICLYPLILLEFLILRVTFGHRFFSAEWLDALQQWYMLVIFIVSLFTYYILFERPGERVAEIDGVLLVSGGDNSSLDISSAESYGAVINKSVELESVPLTSSVEPEPEPEQTQCTVRAAAIRRFFAQYQLTFDLLVAACAFAVLRTCLPKLKLLWPVSKTIILSGHVHWLISLPCGTFALVGLGVVCLCRKQQT